MYNDDLYAYWLTVKGTPEEQRGVFVLLEESGVIDDYLEADGPEDTPYASYCYPKEHGSGPEWNETEMEELLHDIAIKVPGAVLEIEGENTDEQSYGFIKRFHGDLYQESKTITRQPKLLDDMDIPFDQRDIMPTPQEQQKKRILSLYEQMRDAFNENNAIFFVAQNLSYLARCVETNEEVPLAQLYQLAQRLSDCDRSFTQPCLNEERLDAVRGLLENGMDHYGIGEFLTPEETLKFLLSCSDDAFAYTVEAVAAYNQNLYALEGRDEIGEEALKKDLKQFQTDGQRAKTNSLDTRIANASQRAHSAYTHITPEKTNGIDH